jgi:hypothetical protein
MAKRFGRCSEETWQVMEINQNVLNRNFGKYSGRVMFPSSHDIIEKADIKRACYSVIKKLLEAGNDLLITTKPKSSIIKDIVSRFSQYQSQIQFRFTITSIDDKQLSFWEPNAPEFEDRFKSLKYAFKKGFKTSVSIEPFLDYDPRALIDKVTPFVTESIWVGPMNYIPLNNISEYEKPKYLAVREVYDTNHLREIFNDLKNLPKIRFKDSMLNRLAREVESKRVEKWRRDIC